MTENGIALSENGDEEVVSICPATSPIELCHVRGGIGVRSRPPGLDPDKFLMDTVCKGLWLWVDEINGYGDRLSLRKVRWSWPTVTGPAQNTVVETILHDASFIHTQEILAYKKKTKICYWYQRINILNFCTALLIHYFNWAINVNAFNNIIGTDVAFSANIITLISSSCL